VAAGPYDITFHTNGTVGIAEGPARVVNLATVVKRKAGEMARVRRRFSLDWAIGFVVLLAQWPPHLLGGESTLNGGSNQRYQDGWRMAGANPERTSWVPSGPENQTEVPGHLKLEWYRPFDPFIWQKVQIIAADGLLYVATTRGLYAFDAATGDERWVYPTALPLGHSPTVVDSVAHVGCFDRRVHAVDAKTGRALWLSEPAGAGFNTNPVVTDGKLYAGNRDGAFYCLDAKTGKILWQFETELRQPILFSPAYKDGVLYFAANDMHAYTVDAKTGKQVWKSEKLPGLGFHSYWPTLYQDPVIFVGCHGYRGGGEPSTLGGLLCLDDKDIYGSNEKQKGYAGALATDKDAFPWPSATETPTLDLSRKSLEGNGPVTEYFEAKPWRRTYFMLRRDTGKEVTYDFDGDGKPECAPMLRHGTHSGNRFPPIVGGDGLLYQMAGGVKASPWTSRGGILAWKMDTPLIGTLVHSAHDEPHALAAGGNQIYYYHAEAEMDRLLALRAAKFTKDRPVSEKKYDGVFNIGDGATVPLTVSRNFMFLVPELAAHLRANALEKAEEACRHYNEEVLPYWFVAKAEQGDGENTFSTLFDYHALFQAKAMILKEPYQDLVKHLDVPAFYRGDLYYIDNLCACLEAAR